MRCFASFEVIYPAFYIDCCYFNCNCWKRFGVQFHIFSFETDQYQLVLKVQSVLCNPLDPVRPHAGPLAHLQTSKQVGDFLCDLFIYFFLITK